MPEIATLFIEEYRTAVLEITADQRSMIGDFEVMIGRFQFKGLDQRI